MTANILVILISTMVSEVTFSARTRVIYSYHAFLTLETVEMLMYAADWCRKLHEIKKREKVIM